MANNEAITTPKATQGPSEGSQESSFSVPEMETDITVSSSAAGSSTSPQGFMLFPVLPTELQLLIWKQATADIEPRIVEVTYETDLNLLTAAHSTSTSPALLSVCKDARAEAKKTYHELCINGENFTGAVIDYEKDTLFFNTGYATNSLLRNERAPWMSKCRHLALTEQFLFSIQTETGRPYRFLVNFESIETLSAVACDWLQIRDRYSCAVGPGKVHFVEHCTRNTESQWCSKVLLHTIQFNDNIKDAGRVVVASRAPADSSSLKNSPGNLNPVSPTCAACACTGCDANHTPTPLRIPKNIRRLQGFGLLDFDEKLTFYTTVLRVQINQRDAMMRVLNNQRDAMWRVVNKVFEAYQQK